MKKGLWLLCCLCWAVTGMFAQTTGLVKGVVRDAESGETLIGVAVYEETLKVGTVTDNRGAFELTLPYGRHQLQFSFVGYHTLKKDITVGAKSQTLNIQLRPETTTLSEVEITSEKKDQNVSRMAMSVQTLDMITIKRIRIFKLFRHA